MHCFAIILTAAMLIPTAAQARPVSYPDAWTLMLRNNAYQNSAHVHYTFDTKHSLGLRARYDRGGEFLYTGAQLNRLIKRRNTRDSQANLYGRIGAGLVSDNSGAGPKRDNDAAFFAGVSADWETRQYFISGAAEHWDNGRFGRQSSVHSRLGFAPYVANTGALHTWFMVEGHYRPDDDKETGASAILRLFKGPALFELGVDDQGQPLLNYIHRY